MKQENAWKIRVGYGIFLAAATVLLGLLYIFECADIYYSGVNSGGEIFSYDIVGQRLSLLLIPSVLWIVAIIVGYVLSEVFPRVKTDKHKNVTAETLKRLKEKIPVGDSDEYKTEYNKLKKIDISRIAVRSFCATFALVAAIVSIVYLSNLSHFDGIDVNSEILQMLCNVLPWIAVAFLLFVGTAIFECVIISTEQRVVQSLYALGQGGATKEVKVNTFWTKVKAFFSSRIFVYVIRSIVFSLAIVFIVVGIVDGGKDDVLMKAINICTECIGLG